VGFCVGSARGTPRSIDRSSIALHSVQADLPLNGCPAERLAHLSSRRRRRRPRAVGGLVLIGRRDGGRAAQAAGGARMAGHVLFVLSWGEL